MTINHDEKRLIDLIAAIDKALPGYPEDNRQRLIIEEQRRHAVERLGKLKPKAKTKSETA